MRTNQLTRILGLTLAIGFAGCGSREGAPQAGDRPERLEGVWAIELRLEQPIQVDRDVTTVPPVLGHISLIENSRLTSAPGVEGTPTHYGAFGADFRPFGFEPGSDGPVPVAAARLAGDSVWAALGSGGSEVRLRGQLAGDSVSGEWRFNTAGRGGGSASGRFVMRRK